MNNTKASSPTETDTKAGPTTAVTSELNHHLLAEAKATLDTGTPLHLTLPINPTDLAAGSRLAAAIVDRFGEQGLPEGTVNITFHGNAGSGFGAGNITGVDLTLIGEASDCAGQEMRGGQIVVRPSLKSQLEVSNGKIVGNFALERASDGNLFVAGQAGDYFAFRNLGATTVIEGIGDDGCAEMTDGVVVVLGQIGDNFGVGMQGGLAFVLDVDSQFSQTTAPTISFAGRVTDEVDAELLKYLLTRHVRLTGSIRGQEILDDWLNQLERFWKVMPQTANSMPLPRVASDVERR